LIAVGISQNFLVDFELGYQPLDFLHAYSPLTNNRNLALLDNSPVVSSRSLSMSIAPLGGGGADLNRGASLVKLVVGKRTAENTEALAMDLRARIVNRPQITSDGYAPYAGAIENAFGWNVDFAMFTKQYASDSSLPDAAHRYSPGHVTGVDQTVIRGLPDSEKISTSYIALWIAFYNLCRVHETLRYTPAMALGVTDHV
jgi:hypothetical protein